MKASEARGSGPYVGLVPFDAQSADYFFGRSAESEVIAHNVLARPMTVLFGASGAGKSSVLNVGLPKALQDLEVEARIVLRREWHKADELDWIKELNGQVGSSKEPTDPGRADNPGRRWILVLDQFEEFLLYADRKRARDFAKALARFVARRDVEVHVLFSLRDYGVHRLEVIRSELPHLLEGTLELRRLDEAGVRAAIEEPLKAWNERHRTRIELDADFAATLIGQLRAVEQLASAARAGTIEFSYLQLVLQKIWDYENQNRKGGFGKLRTNTLVTQLKGVGGIARAHVDEVLGTLSQQSQMLCSTLVDRLVTPSGGKVLYAAADLAEVAKVPPGRMEEVLKDLSRGRLLREVPLPGSTSARGYEIQHDILAKPFLDWLRERNRREAARRRWTWFAVQFVVFALIFLGLSIWLIDRNEREHREDFLSEELPPPEEGRDRRLLSSLYLLWERRDDGNKRENGIRELEKRGRLLLDRSQDAIVDDLAAPKHQPEMKRPAESSLLLARMDSWLERWDFLKAQRARDALAQAERDAKAEDQKKAKDALKRAGDEWDRRSTGSALVLRPDAFRQEALPLLGRNAAQSTDSRKRDTRLPILHLNPVVGDPDARLVAVSDDLTARVWKAQSGDPVAVRMGCEANIVDAALSRDGHLLAAACADGTVRIWDLACDYVEVLKGDTGVFRALAFSPDAKLLAAGARDGAVRIWQVFGSNTAVPWKCAGSPRHQSEEARILRRRDRRAVEVSGIAFSPNGKRIVIAFQDQTARVWEVANRWRGVELELAGHSDWVTSAAFSPDGEKAVTASYDGTARVWDLETNQNQRQGHRARESDAAASSTVGRPPVVKVAAAKVLQGHTAQVYGASFSPDGQTVVTASKDGTVRLWGQLEAGKPTKMRVLPGNGPAPTSAVFSPDGKKVLAASEEGVVSVWDAHSGLSSETARLRLGARRDAFVYPVHFDIAWKLANRRPLSHEDETLLGFYRALFGAKAKADDANENAPKALDDLERQHPGGDHALAARAAWQSFREGRDRTLITKLYQPDPKAAGRTLDAELRSLIKEHWSKADYSGPVSQYRHLPREGVENLLTSVAFSPDGTRVATASYDGTVRFWDKQSGLEDRGARLEGFLDKLTSVAFSPDGKRLVTASYDGCARVWDWDQGRPRQTFGLQGPDGPQGRPEPLHSAQFSPDGERVVTASRDGTVRVWELEDGSAHKPERERCLARGSLVPSVTIAPSQVLPFDGDPACAARDDDGHEGHHQGGASHRVASAAFSGDGKYVVTSAVDNCARVWDWQAQKVLRVLRGHSQRIHKVAFGPGRDARSVITASYDGTARIWWDWQSANDPAVLRGDQGEVYSATFSPDGARVVTAAEHGVRIWSLSDGKFELRGDLRLPARAGPTYSAAWDPDGKRAPSLATASEDGIARVWHVGDQLDQSQFATELNYRVACTLAESFPEIRCDKANPFKNISESDRREDRLLAAVYAAMAIPDRPGAKEAFGQLRDDYPRTAHALLAAIAVEAGGPSAEPATGTSADGAALDKSAPAHSNWLLARMETVMAYLRPPAHFATKNLADIAMSVVVWPIWMLGLMVFWPIVRWYRGKQGKGDASRTAPDPLRRAWAGTSDFVVAMALGLVVGSLAGTLVAAAAGVRSLFGSEFHLGYRGWELGAVAFVCVSAGYLLFRDAIKYQFRRSIGKWLFGLLPVTEGDAAVRMRDSAKRNVLAVLVYLLVLLPCAALIVWPHWRALPVLLQPVVVRLSESPLIAPWQQLGYAGFAVTVVGLTVLGLVDLTLTCFRDGRTLHDWFAKTKVVRLWTEERVTAVEDDAPSGAGPATVHG